MPCAIFVEYLKNVARFARLLLPISLFLTLLLCLIDYFIYLKTPDSFKESGVLMTRMKCRQCRLHMRRVKKSSYEKVKT